MRTAGARELCETPSHDSGVFELWQRVRRARRRRAQHDLVGCRRGGCATRGAGRRCRDCNGNGGRLDRTGDHGNKRPETAMKQSIAHVALVVRDYDEAIAFFTQQLDFTLVEDTYQPEQDKRWVLVAPPGSTGTSLLLARPSNPEQHAFIGNQTGGRVTFFLDTDDFWRDYNTMVARGIEFVRPPSTA